MADNNIWSVRPNLKKYYFLKPKYKSGFFSLHAASSAFIVFVLLMENKDYLFISLAILLTLIISYLRISDKLHSLKQIVIGLFIGILIGYLISKGTSYSKRGTILFLTIITLVSLYLNYKSFHQTYNELKNTNEDLPTWFDPSLIELYHKKINNNSKVGFRNILLRCFLFKTTTGTALPHALTWQQIITAINQKKIDDFKPDIIIGIKSGGAFVTKYIGEKYKLPYYYINIKKYSQTKFSNIVLDYIKSQLSCVGDHECVMKKSNYKIVETIAPNIIKDKNILLVDDCTATGTTLYRAKEYMYHNGASNVKSLVLTTNNPSFTDYYLFSDNFVGFPWGLDA